MNLTQGLILAGGIVKALLYLLAVRFSFRLRRIVAVAAFGGAVLTSTANTLLASGLIGRGGWLESTQLLASTPVVLLLVAAYLLAPIDIVRSRRWHVW